MYTAVREKKLSLRRMIELICTNPAKAFGLYPKKGVIAPGSDADLVLIDPMRQGAISKDEMFTRCRDSALVFEGWNVYGKPERTIVRGRTVFAGGKILAEPGWGAIVRRAGS
jgi:dihydroorotase-like cyclic amidohydrolase